VRRAQARSANLAVSPDPSGVTGRVRVNRAISPVAAGGARAPGAATWSPLGDMRGVTNGGTSPGLPQNPGRG